MTGVWLKLALAMLLVQGEDRPQRHGGREKSLSWDSPLPPRGGGGESPTKGSLRASVPLWRDSSRTVGDEGFVLERNVKVWAADPLGRLREVHRHERVKYRGGNLLIEDLTFGEKLLIRTDQKSVWKIDPLAGTYSELTFDQVRARQNEVLGEIRAARERVKGTPDDEELKWLLQGFGWFDAEPTLEIRSSGKSASIAGRSAVGKDLVVNGDTYLFSDIYVDESLPVAGYFDALGILSTYPEKLKRKFQEIGGLPLRGRMTHVLFLDRARSEEEVLSVTVAAIAETDFAPPTGLKRVPLKGFEKPVPRAVEKPKDFQRSFQEDEIDRKNSPLGGDKPK